ncbi:MAG: hypothetical protein Aurels2KO_22700 [Aureliella sp.]
MSKQATISDQEVEMDRRREDRRSEEGTDAKAEFNPPRRKKQRRRQIDPTTCERDYNGEEIEFMQALDAYKRSSGRMFPTCSEILEVIRDLGYVRLTEEQLAELAPEVDEDEDVVESELDELEEELDDAVL